jgi:hypothetical protein
MNAADSLSVFLRHFKFIILPIALRPWPWPWLPYTLYYTGPKLISGGGACKNNQKQGKSVIIRVLREEKCNMTDCHSG